jgi:hypothetical protein
VPYLFIAVLLIVGILVLAAVGIRLARALRRLGRVRGWLDDYLTDRTGMLRARSAALAVAVGEFRRDRRAADGPRTINSSLEREDNRA